MHTGQCRMSEERTSHSSRWRKTTRRERQKPKATEGCKPDEWEFQSLHILLSLKVSRTKLYTVQREIFVGANFRMIDQNGLRINFHIFKFRMFALRDCACAHAQRAGLACARGIPVILAGHAQLFSTCHDHTKILRFLETWHLFRLKRW